MFQFKRSDFPTREHYIQAILDAEVDKSSPLALACMEFLESQTRYRNGHGDIISGLQCLDELEKQIDDKFKIE
jgi:RNAse (barnase) inhibitor barstar